MQRRRQRVSREGGGVAARRNSAAGGGAPVPVVAVLFDFNGVLLDDERFHYRACREVVAPFGLRLSRSLYNERYLAYDDRSALRAMLRDAGCSAAARGRRLADLVERKRHAYQRLGGARIRIGPPARALVRAVGGRVPVAIVSGAARREIIAALRRSRLEGVFRTIVAAEEMRRCKPDPYGYRLALRRLGLRGGEGCVAVEDSPGGIAAARAAGLTVLGIGTSYPLSTLRLSGARRAVPSLDLIRPDELLNFTGPRPIACRRASL